MSADLTGSSVAISPTPIEGISFTGIVAKFSDTDKTAAPGQFTASIHWGDGQASPGTVAADPNGGFDISGTHTFSQVGPYRVTAQVNGVAGDVVSISTTNIVAEAPLFVVGLPISTTRRGFVPKTAVALFTDADPDLKASDFSATINWGDGHTSAGRIVANPSAGGFKVIGYHIYRSQGTFSVSTTVRQGPPGSGTYFNESNLISDGAVAADHVNSDFVNPWGLVAPNPGDFWDSNNGTGTSSVFDSLGNPSAGLPKVTVPGPAGSSDPSTPSGIVFNPSKSFVVTDGTKSGPAAFIYATEDGTIAGWSPVVATNGAAPPSVHAVLAVDNSASGAVYKGLTILTVPAGSSLAAGQYLVASNFHSGNLDFFDSNFKPVTLPSGAFQDSAIPAGYAPFGVQSIGGNLYVTYAKQDSAKHDDVAGRGNGYVDVYSTSGVLLQRLGGAGVQPEFNSPWGVALAPLNFGAYSNDLLVGNFGDSHVSVFNPTTGVYLGQLSDVHGKALTLDGGFKGSAKGLWGLFSFSNVTGSQAATLDFASGINAEGDGLFGSLTASTVASGTASETVVVIHSRRH